MKNDEFKQWLDQQGATFQLGQGTHLKVYCNGRQSVLPMNGGGLKDQAVECIKKQLGLNQGAGDV